MTEAQTRRQDPRAGFINASVWHGSLDRAKEILAAHPEVASTDIHTAALLGDHDAVARFLAANPANATAKGGPRNWDALMHLCFSRFLRLDPVRTEGFLEAAAALLDAGANPNTGFFEENHQPSPNGNACSTGRRASHDLSLRSRFARAFGPHNGPSAA